MYKVRRGVYCKKQWFNGGLKGYWLRFGQFFMLCFWVKYKNIFKGVVKIFKGGYIVLNRKYLLD